MLTVDGVTVRIGEKTIITDVSLTVGDGETVAVLGPSGSGKSTLLRAIAGLVEVASGNVTWDGESVAGVPPHLRGFGLMFQGYALFPHLDVAGNVGFGLKMRADPEIDRHVAEALEWVGLAGFGSRSVDGLSGGEQQRVALARTLAPRPRLVMLDEPLGALDRDLRRRLLVEIRDILDQRGVTALVVTHDRDEAAALADRLALMREGTIVQTGTLEEITDNPADDWVEGFLS
ncbi:MAG: ABC transporter ATP-binding protein [Actinobacteria bacterium]|nr:ABC transporter ATP-binding protein [Actinomycetota bacterium]